MSAWNYDAILSMFGKFGLFTFGGFYKEIENIDYTLTSRIFDREDPIYGLYPDPARECRRDVHHPGF